MGQAQVTQDMAQEGSFLQRKSTARIFVFHWYGWRRFFRDLLIMQAGFFLTALSITIFVNAGLGRFIPWGLFEYLLVDSFSVPIAGAFLLVTLAAFLIALLLREPFGWGTPVNFVFVGVLWTTILEEIVPPLPGGIGLQVIYAVVAVVAGAFGTAIFLSVAAGPGPRDSLWLAIARRLRVNPGVAYAILDIALILIALLLGQSVGLATIVHALAVGPAVWLAFRLLNIKAGTELWGRDAGS